MSRGSLAHAFALGLITGIVYFVGTLYWITQVMHQYGGLATWTAVLVNALLILYLSLFPALFAMTMRRLVQAWGPAGLIATPFVWVASELGRMHIMTGFPWVLLGYSQVPVLPIAQFASVLGVFGLSGLVSFVSAALVIAAAGAGLSPAAVGDRQHRRPSPLALSRRRCASRSSGRPTRPSWRCAPCSCKRRA